jgi:hypothetical protein
VHIIFLCIYVSSKSGVTHLSWQGLQIVSPRRPSIFKCLSNISTRLEPLGLGQVPADRYIVVKLHKKYRKTILPVWFKSNIRNCIFI